MKLFTRLFFLLILSQTLCSLSFASNAPKETEFAVLPAEENTNNSSPHWQVYQNAMRNGDFQTAIVALYYEMQANPSQKNLRDTLINIYFTVRAYPQCILLGNEILKDNPNNQQVIEIQALSYSAFGTVEGTKKALESYEKLYSLSRQVYHQYQIANMQFYLKRYGECRLTLGQILNNPESAKEKVSININQQQAQEVPIKAAAFNVLGVMAMEEKDNEGAKKAFNSAIEAYPDFVLPKGNLEQMKKNAAQPAPKPAPGK